MLARVCGYLVHLARGHVLRINPTDPAPFSMHFEHDLGSPFPRQREEQLQHLDHEFHRRVIVVVHDDLEHRRRFDLRLARLDERGAVGFFGHGSAGGGRSMRRTSWSLVGVNLWVEPVQYLIWPTAGCFSSPSIPWKRLARLSRPVAAARVTP